MILVCTSICVDRLLYGYIKNNELSVRKNTKDLFSVNFTGRLNDELFIDFLVPLRVY